MLLVYIFRPEILGGKTGDWHFRGIVVVIVIVAVASELGENGLRLLATVVSREKAAASRLRLLSFSGRRPCRR